MEILLGKNMSPHIREKKRFIKQKISNFKGWIKLEVVSIFKAQRQQQYYSVFRKLSACKTKVGIPCDHEMNITLQSYEFGYHICLAEEGKDAAPKIMDFQGLTRKHDKILHIKERGTKLP